MKEWKVSSSNIVDFLTRLDVLLGLKLSAHTDTVTETSNLLDGLYKRGEIEKQQEYQYAPDNCYTN